jgi:cyclase
MLQIRVIPCLQLVGESLVKAEKFSNYKYIGDPINTVRIFNELEVDELCFLDIRATREKRLPNLKVLKNIANECFMPLSYGGGVRNLETALEIISIGFEKIVINSAFFENPKLIEKIAKHCGVQSLIGAIDVKKNILGKYRVFSNDGEKQELLDPLKWAQQLEQCGVGEILLTSMDKEGTWNGFDNSLISLIAEGVSIPVIANGGAGRIKHIEDAINSGASAVCLGSMVVYQQKNMGVLVNFPDKDELSSIL